MKPPFPSPRIAITLPSADNDLLIAFASLSLSSVAPVLETHSDPAKSTRLNLPTVLCFVYKFLVFMTIEKIRCDQDEVSFIFVDAVFLFSSPKLKIRFASSTDVISSSTAPGITTIP